MTSTVDTPRINRNCNLEDVCGVLGYRATRILAGWYAGRDLRVPLAVTGRHPLSTLIGAPALARLVREFGGRSLSIRSQVDDMLIYRDRVVADAFARGSSVSDVAVLCGVSVARASQLRKALSANGMIDYAVLALVDDLDPERF